MDLISDEFFSLWANKVGDSESVFLVGSFRLTLMKFFLSFGDVENGFKVAIMVTTGVLPRMLSQFSSGVNHVVLHRHES